MNDSKKQGEMMTEASSGTTRSYVFKTNDLCVVAGTSQDVQKTLKFVKEKKLNLKSVQNDAEIARSQEKRRQRGIMEISSRVLKQRKKDHLMIGQQQVKIWKVV